MNIHLQPKQEQLLDLLTATGQRVPTILGFGGAKGGGKSAGSRSCALLLATELGKRYPGLTITIVRRVSDDLKKNHIDELFSFYPDLRQYYHVADKELILPGAGRIAFAYAETTDDVKRKFTGGYQSAFIFVDEAQQFTEEELQHITMACRWTLQDGGLPENLCKTVMLFNPGGKGSDYLRRVFWINQYRGRERPHQFKFMHVFGWDNYEWFRSQVPLDEDSFYELDDAQRFQLFVNDTSYGRDLNSMPDSIRAGYLLGNFDHFENQYFAGAWDEKKCVLTPSMVEELIQPWWTRWMGQDWGFADHSAHYWFASGKIKPSDWMKYFGGHTDYAMDIVIAYREHVISNRAEADLATDIASMTPIAERKQIRRFFLSQDAFGQRAKQGGNTVGETFTKILSRYELPSPETADQNRIMGWRFMYNCLRQANLIGTNISEERSRQGPAFFISAECPQAISCIPMAIRAEDEPDDVERVAGVVWEDCCFVAGTLVRCEQGQVPIEQVRVGMRAWTRQGLREVSASGLTGHSSPIVDAIFSDGSKLTCTPDHRVYTQRGFIRLDEMRYGDTITQWSQLFTGDATIALRRRDISKAGASSCIGKFGSMSVARFLRSIISTTSTAIARTIPSATWNAFSGASTCLTTSGLTLGSFRQPPAKALSSGISLPRAESGIAKSPRVESLNPSRSLASSAGKPTTERGEGSAQEHAKPNGGVTAERTTWRRFANTAFVYFNRAASIIKSSVLGGVPVYFVKTQRAGFADVYNLTVDGPHEYFANGILVANCDGLRYGLHTMLNPQSKAPRDIRAKELYDSIQGENVSDVMTARAMAIAKFNQAENVVRRVSRAPRWRG